MRRRQSELVPDDGISLHVQNAALFGFPCHPLCIITFRSLSRWPFPPIKAVWTARRLSHHGLWSIKEQHRNRTRLLYVVVKAAALKKPRQINDLHAPDTNTGGGATLTRTKSPYDGAPHADQNVDFWFSDSSPCLYGLVDSGASQFNKNLEPRKSRRSSNASKIEKRACPLPL